MTVLVLGGSGGLGRAIVRRYASAGHTVVSTYLRAEHSARAVVDELATAGHSVRFAQLDIRNSAALERLIDQVGDEIDGVILALGSGVSATVGSHRDRHWDWVFDTNPRALARVFQVALPRLSLEGGFVTALTSIGSSSVLPMYALVGPAKAALEAIVRYAACEAGPFGVRVNAVSPGLVVTKALAPYPDIDRRIEETTTQTPLGRLVTPEDVAELIYWLGSPAAQMITGQTIVIDGGWTLRHGVQ